MALFAALMVARCCAAARARPAPASAPARSVSWLGVGRNLALAAGFAALPSLPSSEPSTDEWLAARPRRRAARLRRPSAVAVLALAREVGMLRLRLGTQAALEIAGEGPELGDPAPHLAERIAPGRRPAGARGVQLGGLPRLPDAGAGDRERRERPAGRGRRLRRGRRGGVVGGASASRAAPSRSRSTSDGTVLAKGTFNNLAQLESVLATGGAAPRERRDRGGRPVARRRSEDFRSVPEHLDGSPTRCAGHLAAGVPRAGSAARWSASRRRGPSARWSSPARPTPSTSAATSSRPAPAPTRRACRGSTRTASRCGRATGSPIDDLGRPVNGAGRAGRRERPAAARPRRPAAAARAADAGLRPGRRASTASGLRSTAAGTAAAAARSASWSTAARALDRASTATPRSTGYCYAGRKVFCVMYFDTKVPC